MTQPATLDVAVAHRHFSADCFNRAWALLDKGDRTAEEGLLMLSLAHASLYHWSQRPDCAPLNVSVAYWLLSRVNATLGLAADAYSYAVLCLAKADGLPPFFRGYAYEALARAESLSGNGSAAAAHLAMARSLAAQVTDAGDRARLEADVAEIERGTAGS
jgi:hypothetical protein